MLRARARRFANISSVIAVLAAIFWWVAGSPFRISPATVPALVIGASVGVYLQYHAWSSCKAGVVWFRSRPVDWRSQPRLFVLAVVVLVILGIALECAVGGVVAISALGLRQ